MQPENTEKPESLADFVWRLHSAMDSAKPPLTQKSIAEKLGVPPSRVGNWFQGRNFPRRREGKDLARILGVSWEWLITGEHPEKPDSTVEEAIAPHGGSSVREVPVISWSHAGVAASYEEMPRHWHGSAPTSSRDKRAFALTIEGDSMEPKFFAGDRVILEPSVQPVNGKPAVAKFATEAVQLRIYHRLPNGKIRLSSLRPEIYPTFEYEPSDFSWIFPVRELVRTV